MDGLLDKSYYNPVDPGSYGGQQRLQRATGAKLSDVREFLEAQDTYTLHKPSRRRFKRRRYIVDGIDDLWQADLADLQSLKRSNGGYTFVLVVIDVFSKYVWARPLKRKTASETLDAIDDIIVKSQRRPKNMMTDNGTEFVNANARNYYENVNINFYTSNNPETKAAVAERVIRTLKSRIYRYMTKHNTKRYIDVLQDIVSSYNNSKHRSIKMKPIEVTAETESKARKNLYPISITSSRPEFKFSIGDTVRIAITPGQFTKGYLPRWSEELFTVLKRRATIPPTYKISDEDTKAVAGTFYEPELQRILIRGASPEL